MTNKDSLNKKCLLGASNELEESDWASVLLAWWQLRGFTVLRFSIILMVIAAVVWLGYEFWRLLFQTTSMGAIDLRLFHTSVGAWFKGDPVYPTYGFATYPPASFVHLWPFVGWLSFQTSRWLWAVTIIAAIAWLIRLLIGESGAKTMIERRFITLIPLAVYATGASVGNGQLIVHILPCLITSLLVLREERVTLTGDLLGAALFLAALVKPSVTAPFFGIVLFGIGRIRPAIFIVVSYILVTLFSLHYQAANSMALMAQWHANTQEAMIDPSIFKNSFGNLHSSLHALGFDAWLSTASLSVLSLLLAWIALYRRGDLWGLMSVCAIVSLLYTYHGWYDHLLMLVPMIATYRIARQTHTPPKQRAISGILMGALLFSTIAPGGIYLFPSPFREIYVAGQVSLWLIVLFFLVHQVAITHPQKTANTDLF